MDTSRSELLTMLSEEELTGVPLLVFCNKQDVKGAMPPDEVSEKLGLAGGETGREWSVRGSCAIKGEGLEEGLDWYVPCLASLASFRLTKCLQAGERDSKEVALLLLARLLLVIIRLSSFYWARTLSACYTIPLFVHHRHNLLLTHA